MRLAFRLLAIIAMFFAAASTARANPDPTLGRFLQRDPNATGMIVLDDATWYHGRAPMPGYPNVDPASMYANGANLHQYLGSNPLARTDPMGLEYDPFDEAFAIIGEHLFSGLLVVSQAQARAKEGLSQMRAYEQASFLWDEMVMDRDEGILLGLIIALPFSRACFIEGTLVQTENGLVPIESIGLGDVVLSRMDPELLGDVIPGAVDAANATDSALADHSAEAWDTVSMTVLRAGGGSTDVRLLRPAEWASSLGLAPGVMFDLAVSEAELSGRAIITGIEAFTGEVRLDAPITTACFVTEDMPIILLSVEGLDLPIGLTASHRLFSEDRGTWVAAGELVAGEKLATSDRAVRVVSVNHSNERVTVYNLEVTPTHTYFASEAEVWAHNGCAFPPSGRRDSKMRQREWVYETTRGMRAEGGASPRVIRDSVMTHLRDARLTKPVYQELVAYLDHLIRLMN